MVYVCAKYRYYKKNRPLLISNICFVSYSRFLYFNLKVFHLNFALIGVIIQELITLPLMFILPLLPIIVSFLQIAYRPGRRTFVFVLALLLTCAILA